MRRNLLAGAFSFVLSLAAGAATQTSSAELQGMVENPCPAPLAEPDAVRRFNEAFLRPGPVDLPHLIGLTRDPSYVAYDAEKKARAARDWAGLCIYREANRKLVGSGERPSIVFLGDSITENWVRADPAFFSDGRVGRGVGGQTSGQMLARFRADVVALRPRIVHIMAGTNDVAGNGGPTSPQAFQDNIKSMVEIARANEIKVVLASIPPADRFLWAPGLKPAGQIVELNVWLRDYASREELGFVDYHTLLADQGGGLPREFGIDGVHPNQAGYAAMRDLAVGVR